MIQAIGAIGHDYDSEYIRIIRELQKYGITPTLPLFNVIQHAILTSEASTSFGDKCHLTRSYDEPN